MRKWHFSLFFPFFPFLFGFPSRKKSKKSEATNVFCLSPIQISQKEKKNSSPRDFLQERNFKEKERSENVSVCLPYKNHKNNKEFFSTSFPSRKKSKKRSESDECFLFVYQNIFSMNFTSRNKRNQNIVLLFIHILHNSFPLLFIQIHKISFIIFIHSLQHYFYSHP